MKNETNKNKTNAFCELIAIYYEECKNQNKYFGLLKLFGFITLIIKLLFSLIPLSLITIIRKCLNTIPHSKCEKLIIDYFVLFKLVISIVILIFRLNHNFILMIFLIYLSIDSIYTNLPATLVVKGKVLLFFEK